MATLHARVSALDQTMVLFSPSLNPVAAGAVNAHNGPSSGPLSIFLQRWQGYNSYL